MRRGYSWADARGAVSESAGYRTWSIKLLIVPKSLVTIATIIRRVSIHYLAYREFDCAFCSFPGIVVFRRFVILVLLVLLPNHSPSQLGRIAIGWTRERRARCDKSVQPRPSAGSWQLLVEAAATSTSTSAAATSLRACATLAPRTTNRGLESGLACHPYLCHWRAAPRALPTEKLPLWIRIRFVREDCATPAMYRVTQSVKALQARSIARARILNPLGDFLHIFARILIRINNNNNANCWWRLGLRLIFNV